MTEMFYFQFNAIIDKKIIRQSHLLQLHVIDTYTVSFAPDIFYLIVWCICF